MPPGYYSDDENDEPFNPIATNGEAFPWLLPDLPTNIRPIQYILTIHPNLTNMDVKGQITIDFVIDRETNFIVLHVQDLNITEKAIITPKGYALRITRMLEFPPRQQLYLEIKVYILHIYYLNLTSLLPLLERTFFVTNWCKTLNTV